MYQHSLHTMSTAHQNSSSRRNNMETSNNEYSINFSSYGKLIYDKLDSILKASIPELRFLKGNILDFTYEHYFEMELHPGHEYEFQMVSVREEEFRQLLFRGIVSSILQMNSISSGDLVFRVPSDLDLLDTSLVINVDEDEDIELLFLKARIQANAINYCLALVVDAEAGIIEEITPDSLVNELSSIPEYNDELSIEEIAELVSNHIKMTYDELMSTANSLYDKYSLSDASRHRRFLAEFGLVLVESRGVKIHDALKDFDQNKFLYELDISIRNQ